MGAIGSAWACCRRVSSSGRVRRVLAASAVFLGGCHPALRRATDARVGPALFPAIQIRLRFLQALEAHPFHRLIAARKTVVGHQGLPDRLAIASQGRGPAQSTPCTLHTLADGGEGSLGALCFSEKGVIKSGVTYGRFCRRATPQPGRQTTTRSL
jgi:hypothetical protein